MAAAITFGGGMLLGLASSLHCVGMCGGIALILGLPAARGEGQGIMRLAVHLPLHVGRGLSYALLGGLAGGLGAAVVSVVAVEEAHLLMRWAASMTLAWVGLSMLGLMPSPSVVGHALLPRFALAGRPAAHPVAGGLAAGIGWGLMPCGMVYGALLFAAFAGSALGGMAVMAGFALGTMPTLLLVQSGQLALARFARRPEARWLAGVAILIIAAVSLMPPEMGLAFLCRSAGPTA
ncbi:MAG: sulfite exporter TauE/SafE family protein [Sphingobium sp.]|nr:sulfite exporter TauE/SafE family protein [Sphingobium sp.]